MTLPNRAVGFALTVMVIVRFAVLTKNFTFSADVAVVFDPHGLESMSATLALCGLATSSWDGAVLSSVGFSIGSSPKMRFCHGSLQGVSLRDQLYSVLLSFVIASRASCAS